MVNLFVKINSEEKSYPILIENEEISELKKKIFDYIKNRNFLVVISQKVEKLYGKKLNIPKENKFVLKDGEKEKNFKNYEKILNCALKLKLTRNDVIIAIGGGVVGDITGFAAATYMRGIDFIQVPTTLLACVDSSVGGKTAIDTKFGKNLVGAFYQPKVVFINPKFLKTLDDRQFKTGLGEVVKYSFIEKSCKCDEELHLTNFLTEKSEQILERKEKILSQLIEICVKLKISVVEKDEKEGGLRRILNFGHTYAHAIEKITNYRKFTHGEAVVEGIKFAFNLAVKKNLIDKNYKFLAEDIIKKYLYQLLSEWDNEWKQKNSDSNAELFGHLFMHLKQHGDTMMLIQKRGLFHLFKESYLTLWGPSETMDNMTAYTVVFVANGILGWIEEWLKRGMCESAETMSTLLSMHGML